MLGIRLALLCVIFYASTATLSYEALTNGLLSEVDVAANPDSSKIILDAIEKEIPIVDMRALNALQQTSPAINFKAGTSLLTESCNNMNCDFFYYYFTCHDFGIHLDKTCANYIVGM